MCRDGQSRAAGACARTASPAPPAQSPGWPILECSAVLHIALKKRRVTRQLDSRILTVTATGRREIPARLGVTLDERIPAA